MASKGKAIKRVDIGSELPEVCELPDLIGIQTESYRNFLQLDKLERGEAPDPAYGLEHVFRTTFPIVSPNEDMKVEYNGYTVDMAGIKYSESECKKKGRTFGVPVKAKIALETVKNGLIKEKEIFFGDFPLMTDRGTFIINGAERVIVSQIVRSPGIIFKEGKKTDVSSLSYTGTLYPYSGTKLEFVLTRKNEKESAGRKETEKKKVNNIIQVNFGKKPFLVTFFLRVLGVDTREKIVSAFFSPKTLDLTSLDMGESHTYFLYNDIRNQENMSVQYVAGKQVGNIELQEIKDLGYNEIQVIDTDAKDLDSPSLAVLKTLHREFVYIADRDETEETSAIFRDETSEEFQCTTLEEFLQHWQEKSVAERVIKICTSMRGLGRNVRRRFDAGDSLNLAFALEPLSPMKSAKC